MPAKFESNKTKKALKKIGRRIVNRAKQNLKDSKASGQLESSVRYRIVQTKGSMYLEILSEAYGDVLDKGLSGTALTRPDTDYRAQPFLSYTGAESISISNRIKIDYKLIRQWIIEKPIPVDDIDSAAYNISRHLVRYGYPARRWLTNAKEKEKSTMIKELEKSMASDVVVYIRNTANQ